MRRQLILGVAILVALSSQAFGEIQFNDGQWRLELSGFESFKNDAVKDDLSFFGSVEYEFPATAHTKLSFRGYPAFVFCSSAPIYGVGLGVAGRIYQHAEQYDGLFAELGVSALWHSREFPGINTHFNFLSEVGIGYKFPDTGWHVTLKAQHISNANLGSKNSGINNVGIAAGYTFRLKDKS